MPFRVLDVDDLRYLGRIWHPHPTSIPFLVLVHVLVLRPCPRPCSRSRTCLSFCLVQSTQRHCLGSASVLTLLSSYILIFLSSSSPALLLFFFISAQVLTQLCPSVSPTHSPTHSRLILRLISVSSIPNSPSLSHYPIPPLIPRPISHPVPTSSPPPLPHWSCLCVCVSVAGYLIDDRLGSNNARRDVPAIGQRRAAEAAPGTLSGETETAAGDWGEEFVGGVCGGVTSIWGSFLQCKKSGFTILIHRTKVRAIGRTKFPKCAHKLFSFFDFANGGRNHAMPANVKHCLHSLYAIKVYAGRKLCLPAQAAAQMLFRQTKNTHSLQ